MNRYEKKIAFLGDSITEGTGVSSENARYDMLLKNECQLRKICNYGIGGTRIAYQQKPSEKPRYDLYFCGRAYNIDRDADVVVVFGGTNDYGHGDAPFGTLKNTTPDTFCGAVDMLIRILLEQCPKSKIVFVTPARRLGDLRPSTRPNKRADARPLVDYVQVILAKCNSYQIPVLNLYEKFTFDTNSEADCLRYTVDGLHLNDLGHRLLADWLKEFLIAL